jgi:hypothetical protein
VITDRVIADGRRARGRRRLAVTSVAGVSVLVAAIAVALVVEVVAGNGASTGSPRSIAMQRLAIAAAHSPATELVPGKYLHLVDKITEGSDVLTLESWTSADGYEWRRDTDDGTTQYYLFAPPPAVDPEDPTPAYLASLPTDPSQLGSYLQSHVTGSSSKDQAIYVAVGDLMRPGYASPALSSALIQVLESTANVTAETTTDRTGRPAVKVTFTDPTGLNGPDSLLFDPTNSALIEEQEGPRFTADYTERDVVDAVPSDVVSHTGSTTANPTPTATSRPTSIPASRPTSTQPS